jgi:hypothetical protein
MDQRNQGSKNHTQLKGCRIRIIFQDPDPFPSVLRSGSVYVSYSYEHNKINWKGQFNNLQYAWRSGPGGHTDKENQIKMYKKYHLMYITSMKQ